MNLVNYVIIFVIISKMLIILHYFRRFLGLFSEVEHTPLIFIVISRSWRRLLLFFNLCIFRACEYLKKVFSAFSLYFLFIRCYLHIFEPLIHLSRVFYLCHNMMMLLLFNSGEHFVFRIRWFVCNIGILWVIWVKIIELRIFLILLCQ